MVEIKSSLSVIICFLVMTWAIGSPLGPGRNDDQNSWSKELEAEFQARLLQDKKRETTNDGATSGSEKAPIYFDNELVENRITDCVKGQELIVTGDDGTGTSACYLHQMNDAFYQSACLGNGQVNQLYLVKDEIMDKDFLTQNGPDSVCRNRPMYLMTFVKDVDPKVALRNETPKKGKFLDIVIFG